MNWYKRASAILKTASVTLHPADSGKVYQPMTLSDLHWNLLDALWPEVKRASEAEQGSSKKIQTIIRAMRGDHSGNQDQYKSTDPESESGYSAYTGSFSFETYPPVDPDEIARLIDGWADHMELVDDFEIIWGRENGGTGSMEYWWLKSSGIDPELVTKWYLSVLKNPSKNASRIPELNVANANWAVLFRMLFPAVDNDSDIDDDRFYVGSLGIEELEARLSRAERMFKDNKDRYTQSPSDSHNLDIPEDASPEESARIIREQHQNRKHMRVFDFGLPKERILWYFDQIREIINYCKKHGVSKVSWS